MITMFDTHFERMPSHRRIIASLLALGLAACGAETAPTTDRTVRDSAGVHIVEYVGTPTAGTTLAFSAEPLYTHGTGTGDYLFQSIWTGALMPDGSAAISDAGNAEIVLLGPDGSTQETLAGPGEGPGEVGFVASLLAVGQDSLLVEDDVNAQFTLLANGSIAQAVSVRGSRVLTRGLVTHGIDSAGQLLMASSSFRRGFEQAWLPGHMVRLALETQVADTVASYDWVPRQPPEGSPENPFPHYGLVGASGGQFIYGRTDTPEILWRRPDGTVRQIVRWQPEWVYPTDEHWALFEAEQRAILPEINPQVQTDAAVEELIRNVLAGYRLVPDEPLPLFGSPFFGDDEGRVWLAGFAVDWKRNEAPHFDVIAEDGEWLGVVHAPARFRVLDVAGGRVLGVLTDEMDVESVVVYELLVS